MSIPITKPFQPPIEEYQAYLKDIWQRNWLTNNGPLVKELEARLKDYLGLKQLLFLSNGTIALQIAIKALDLKGGEIITTPFSYVATTSSLVWEGCTPIFVDIDPDTLNIDAHKIEAAISPNTRAILATHVYGNPCDIEYIQELADKHQLKVIYDAAHAFGVKYNGKSIYEYGNISTASFHATKIFHTVEGGAVITNDPALNKKMSLARNFGHNGLHKFKGAGINAKNSEFHAAMGLCNLKYIDDIIDRRKTLAALYTVGLAKVDINLPKLIDPSQHNYAYYPIIFNTETDLLKVDSLLQQNEIFTRRYFYPLLSKLDYVSSQPMPIADDIAKRILCLPIYDSLRGEDVTKICELLSKAIV